MATKWDNVKRTVAMNVRSDIMRGADYWTHGDYPGWIAALREAVAAKTDWRSEVEKLADAAYNRVMEWDIRCAGKLRDLFPQYFPATMRRGRLTCYMADNANSDWMLDKAA